MTKATMRTLCAMLWLAAATASAQTQVPAIGQAGAQAASVNRRIDQVLGDHAAYEPVIRAFQHAVASGDAAAVAALVAYPLKARLDGKPATIRDARDFVAHYGQIVTPAMAAVIARQPYGTLFVNDQGVMFGNGEAWIRGVCRDQACKQFDVKVVTLQPGT